MHKKHILPALSAGALLVANSFAASIYNETFESYTLGDSNGQGLWVDFGGDRTADIVSSNANGGTQSISFSTNPEYGADSTIDLAAPITSGQLKLTFDIYHSSGFDGFSHVFLSRGATLIGNFDDGLHMIGDGTAGTLNGAPLLTDAWAPVEVNIDLGADTAVATYNGTEIFNGAWNNAGTTATQFQGVNIWADGGANVASFEVDNFHLQTVPEPTGPTLLALGLISSTLRRRR